jgi:hypothetical protein
MRLVPVPWPQYCSGFDASSRSNGLAGSSVLGGSSARRRLNIRSGNATCTTSSRRARNPSPIASAMTGSVSSRTSRWDAAGVMEQADRAADGAGQCGLRRRTLMLPCVGDQVLWNGDYSRCFADTAFERQGRGNVGAVGGVVAAEWGEPAVILLRLLWPGATTGR